ncbi:hypothetical protein CVT24_013325 [Panaeolus cyanescens]|uniref:Uncharacterized protein n=1 Tax=Panaeolus cyanescens TaxID=181874 RepID=A0A409WD68_9AGAR|nr:hypothetical protein CVT24_013325 [Panaeolus cyanescens]
MDDDYVETSDVEELMAEQLDCRARRLNLAPVSDENPPRKRIKLFHNPSPSPPIPATSPNFNVTEGSQAHSIGTQDATIGSPMLTELPENSQDPLLLCSPSPRTQKVLPITPSAGHREKPLSNLENVIKSTTPLNSPPSNFYDMTPTLRFSFSRLPTSPLVQPSSQHLFSPGLPASSPSHLSFPSSPLTRESAQLPDPFSPPSPFSQPPSLSPSSPATLAPVSSTPAPASPLPSVSLPRRLPEPDPPEIPPELMAEQRYSFRKRAKEQEKPFTAEKRRYEMQLRNIPDAIVSNKSIRRHRFPGDRHAASDEDESQEVQYEEEPEQDPDEERFWREQERRQKKTASITAEQPAVEYYGILKEDISSQEEDEVTKDARRLARAERKKKAKEKPAKSKSTHKSRPQKYPLPEPTAEGFPADYFDQYELGDDDQNDQGREDPAPDFNDFGMIVDPPNVPSSPSVREELEIVDDTNNNDVVSISSHSGSEGEMDVDPEEPAIEGAKMKILKRMYPTMMIKTLIKATGSINGKHSRQKSVEAEPSNDPLLPGQSRIRRAENPKDIRDIKGDSESSEDEPPSKQDVIDLSDSDSTSDGDLSNSPRRRLHKGKQTKIVHHFHDTSESDNVSDEALEMYLAPVRNNNSFGGRESSPVLREMSLIDYMLSKPARIGGKSKSKGRTGHSSGNKKERSFRLDVTTGGARRYGKEKQTRLSFDNPGSSKGSYRPKDLQPKARSRERNASGYHADEDEVGQHEDVVHHTNKLDWKARYKRRKQKEKNAGVYCFGNGNGQVQSGRGRAAFITVDLEDEAFRQALIPRSTPTAVVHERHPLAWPRLVTLDPELQDAPARTAGARPASTEDVPDPPPPPKRRSKPVHVPSDYRFPLIPAVKSFGKSSYTGSGYLHSLLLTLSGTPPQLTLINHTFLQFDLVPSMSIYDFCALIPKIFESYIEFSTDLPSPDTKDLCASWQAFGHLVHEYCTSFMGTGDPTTYNDLCDTIKPELARVVEHFKSVTPASLDLPVLQLYWFSLELSLRLSAHNGLLPSVSSGVSQELVSCLMRLLFQFGFKDIARGLRKEREWEGASASYRAAEIWVWLIHVLDPRRVTTASPKQHPFWEPLKEQINVFASATGMQASEDFWTVIFTLCFLSQMNDYGMATSQPRLPACWELAVAALKRVQLDALPNNPRITDQTRQRHDHYIGILLSRCHLLRDRWQWKGAPYELLNVLSSIFKSRLYANLLDKHSDYPKFFREQSWEQFTRYDDEDTAFGHFLVLIGHAVQDSINPTTGKPSLNLKKLTSMFLPVSPLSFTKTNPAGARGMGMFYNRISGAAVAAHLDPTDADSRVAQARKYLSFADGDTDIRVDMVRGLMMWGSMMVSDRASLNGIIAWATEIAEILAEELKEVKAENEADSEELKAKRRYLVVTTMGLVVALRQIGKAHLAISAYPDPRLIGCMKSLLNLWFWKADTLDGLQSTANEFLRFNNIFFDARIAALPPPERPVKPVQRQADEPESQDYIVDDLDLDWDAAELPDALKDANTTSEVPAWVEKENELRTVLSDTKYKWKLVKFVTAAFIREVPMSEFEKQAANYDAWMKSIVSVGVVEGDPERWDKYHSWFSSPVNNAKDKAWAKRMILGFYYYILRLEPKSYLISDLKRKMILDFLNCLISFRFDMESRYTALLLSIDGLQHPLFRHMDCLPDPTESNGDYNFQDGFKELRLPILRVIFQNAAQLVKLPKDDPASVLEGVTCIDYLKETFSTIRTRHATLSKLADTDTEMMQQKHEYEVFCADVFDACFEHLELRNHQQILFWVNWRRNNLSAVVRPQCHD